MTTEAPATICTDVRRQTDEPLAGTAPVARLWVLVEQPGPWGRDALTESHLPTPVGRALKELAADRPVRLGLIRSVGSHVDAGRGPRRLLVARTDAGAAWLTTRLVDDVESLPRLLSVDTLLEAPAPPPDLPGVINHRVAPGTANMKIQPAMDEAQLALALAAGKHAVGRGIKQGMQLFIGGDMGIANTTAATAIACAVLSLPAKALTGPGTGLDEAGVRHKAEVIQSALNLHRNSMATPLEILRCVGGFEIAALCGAYLSCAQQGIPFIVDGFIAGSAALLALAIQPAVKDWLFMAHRSAEPGHRQMLDAMGVEPLLDLGMRLGEGSGAATAVPLLRMAAASHTQMATFAQAGVSGKV